MPDTTLLDLPVASSAAPALPSALTAGQLLRRITAPLHSFRLQTALVFGGLTVLFCAALAFVLGDMLTDEIRHDSARSLDAVAQTAARTLESGLAQRLRDTRVLANSPSLWAEGLAAPRVAAALERGQQRQPFSAWIGAADLQGRVQSSTGGMLIGQSVLQRPWFGHGLEGAYVGDVHRALLLERLLPKAASGEPVRFVDFSAPIKVDGKVIGVLGMHGTWDWSREVVASMMPTDAVQRGLAVYIFDRAGRVLFAPNASTTPSAAAAASSLSLDDLHPQSKTLADNASDIDGARPARVMVWPDGQAYLTTIVTLPAADPLTDLGWQVVAREPSDKAFAKARHASRKAFGIGIVIAAFAGLLAWFASGVLGRPLVALARAAQEVRNRVPGAAIPVLRDNHEVQHLSTALAGMARRLDATYSTAPVGMCQVDLDGRVLSANDRLGDILGTPSRTLLRRRLVALMVDIDRAVFTSDLRQLGQGMMPTLSRELCFQREGGGPLHAALSASMVPPMNGDAAYFIVVVEDISQRRAAEAAESANAAKTAFLSQVSHELRTPLNAVIGFSQLMQIDGHHELSAKQLKRVDAIAGAGKHLLAMINDLLDMTQIESNRMTMSLAPVTVSKVVDESVALVSEAARVAGVSVSLVAPSIASEDCVHADPLRLRQVLVNLLSNAIKYNRPGGSVTVNWGAASTDERIELSVLDTGQGIRADRMVQLFQPFNRLGAETSAVQGTGIGLVITRRLVEMMGGEIRVRSTPEVGSCFSILLPSHAGSRGSDAPENSASTALAEAFSRTSA